ncbi:MAG: hypothetical protein ACOYVF_13770 [Candidatus Zixiibacteriota bacterium]
MNFRISALTFLIFASFFISCSTKEPLEPEEEIPCLMPLAIGNSWSEIIRLYYPSGEISMTITGSSTVTSRVIIDNEYWYRIDKEFNYMGDITHSYHFLCHKVNGLWYRSDVAATPELKIKYPLVQGEITQLENGYKELVSLDTIITVPAGTFNCYYWRSYCTSNTCRTHQFFAPGYGYIKYINELTDDYGYFFTEQLTETNSLNLQ